MSATPQPNASVAHALSLWRSGRRQEALELCESLAASGEDADALSLLAEIQAATGRPEQAVHSLQRLVRARPADAAGHRRLGNALSAAGDFAGAVDSYRKALNLEPQNVRAHNNLGQALLQLGRNSEARASYEQAIELDPGYAVAHNNLGIALFERGEYPPAIASYERACEIDPTFVEPYYNRGNALLRSGRPLEAIESYNQALALRPNSFESLLARGNALQEAGRSAEAVESYERALTLVPNHAEALSNCGSALLTLKRPEEALRYCERAIQLEPDLVEAHNNLGGALRKLHRLQEANAACERALQLQPGYAAALANHANIMLALNRFEEALEFCYRALALQPMLAEAHDQRGAALSGAKRPAEAALAYERLLEIHPDYPCARGSALNARLTCCDWTRYDSSCAEIAALVEAGKFTTQPFALLAINASPELHLQCARVYVDDQLRASAESYVSGQPHASAKYASSDPYATAQLQRSGFGAGSNASPRHERIRIAYLSADFHEHATAMLMAGLFEAHDRQRFETIALSFGPEDSSPMRRRLERAFDRFIDVRHMSDAQVVDLARSLEVDIAVDLKGYTGDSRPGIFARRAAPVQVSYLGYPGTLGLQQMDYILADPIVLPPEQQIHYTERVVYLPECYQVNDDKRVIATHIPAREELGLPTGAFVFCCFNNHYKISPAIFAVWMRLLREIPGSVLWLLEDNATAVANLRREAESRGVSAERLIFATRLPADAHLARHRAADLFLDTLPYNAHTTTADALWAGLPVLTCLGSAFPGRVAASLLNAVGLPELVARTLEDYAATALELTSDRKQLDELRARLAENRRTSSLFDTARFCEHLQMAYTTMWQRQQAGLSPEGFTVSPLARA